MKKLYLLRHAKSSWDYPELADFERPLNKRGRRDAPLMGKRLAQLKIRPDLIISSPASRAAVTARIIAEELDYPIEKIDFRGTLYAATSMQLLGILRNLDSAIQEVIVIGHNPEFTSLANTLADNAVTNIPTCGVYGIEFELNAWQKIDRSTGKMLFFEYPKKLSTGNPT